MQLRMGQILHRVDLTASHHGRGHTAQQRRSQIVRVSLDLRCQRQQLPAVKGFSGHIVGSGSAGGDQRRRGAKPPAHGNLSVNVDMHRRHVAAAQLLPDPGIGHIGQILFILILLLTAGKAQLVRRCKGECIVQSQRAAQHIKTGGQIGRCGRNTNRHLFHSLSPAFLST